MKQIFFCILFFSLTLSLAPKNNKKNNHKDTKSPYEIEKETLKEALYCNDDNMQKGDVCYCGRIFLSCCASKDKCTGTLTRSCSQTVDDYKCDN